MTERSALKVLVIPSWYPPEGGSFFRQQAHQLAGAGIDVAVAYARPLWPRSLLASPRGLQVLRQRCSLVVDKNVPTFVKPWLAIPSRARLEPAQTARCTLALMHHVVERWGRPDLVHAHSLVWGGYAACCIKREWGIPYVVTEPRGRFSLPRHGATDLLPKWYDPFLRETIRCAHTVALVGSHQQARLRPLAQPTTRFGRIPYGVDTDYYGIGETPGDAPFRFVFVGNVSRQKGILTLVRAFALVHSARADTQLTIVGRGPEAATVAQMVRDLDLTHAVELRGRITRDALRDTLMQSHVCVLPSQFEGLPVSPCEAMSVGIPVIVSRGSPPELFPDDVGVRIAFDDTNSLADAMLDVAGDYARYDRQRIRHFAVTQYGLQVTLERVLAMYHSALDA